MPFIKGYKQTAQHKSRLKKALTGRKVSDETKLKMSKSNKRVFLGKNFSEEHKAKLREAWKTRPPMKQETREKKCQY